MATARRRVLAIAATLAAAVVWGTSFSANDVGLRVVDPYTFVFLRFVLAALVALALAAVTGGLEARLLREPRIWLLGATNGLGFLAQYVGQCWTTPARTALLVNSNVFLVALLSFLVFRERLGATKSLAVAGGFAGVVLLSFQQGQPGACGVAWWGDVVVFAGSLAWAVYIIVNRRAITAPGARLLPVGGWSFAVTALVLAPTLAFADAPLRVPWPAGWPVVYAALATTVLTYVLWSWGLRVVSATVSVVLLLVEVLVAVAVSLAIGREVFTALSVVGALVLAGSVAWLSLAEARDARV